MKWYKPQKHESRGPSYKKKYAICFFALSRARLYKFINALQAFRYLPVWDVVKSHKLIVQLRESLCLAGLLFFHCLKGPPVPLSDQFWTSAVGPFVRCTPGVYWFAVCDFGCFKKQQVLWGKKSVVLLVYCAATGWRWVLWWTHGCYLEDYIINVCLRAPPSWTMNILNSHVLTWCVLRGMVSFGLSWCAGCV